MSEEDKLDAEIAKAEEELQQLRRQLENNAAAAAARTLTGSAAGDQAAAGVGANASTEPDDKGAAYTDPPAAAEPLSAFLDWSQQRAALDLQLTEQLQARLNASEAVNDELQELVTMLERETSRRRQQQDQDIHSVLRSITQRRHEQRRLRTVLRTVLNDVLATIHNEPDLVSIQQLLDRLLTLQRERPSEPYVDVDRNVFMQHLMILERAGIIRFQPGSRERRVRLVDLAPSLTLERIQPVEAEQSADSASADSGRDSSSS